VTAPLAISLWPLESTTILLSRFVYGAESTLERGDRYLTDDTQEAIAERHSHQVTSMLESRTDLD
jgi:hypothetical protein